MAAASLPDVTFRPDGTLAPMQETTFLAGATWHATPLARHLWLWRAGSRSSARPSTSAPRTLGLGNPALNLCGCLVEGGACSPNLQTVNQINAGFWWRAYQGKFGSFRFGMQYSYTHLTRFRAAPAASSPTTDDSMVFTSIRYYPF